MMLQLYSASFALNNAKESLCEIMTIICTDCASRLNGLSVKEATATATTADNLKYRNKIKTSFAKTREVDSESEVAGNNVSNSASENAASLAAIDGNNFSNAASEKASCATFKSLPDGTGSASPDPSSSHHCPLSVLSPTIDVNFNNNQALITEKQIGMQLKSSLDSCREENKRLVRATAAAEAEIKALEAKMDGDKEVLDALKWENAEIIRQTEEMRKFNRLMTDSDGHFWIFKDKIYSILVLKLYLKP